MAMTATGMLSKMLFISSQRAPRIDALDLFHQLS
jgi:hypothetical protein